MIEAVLWIENKDSNCKLKIIDQRLLPESLEYIETDKLDITYTAIKELAVRGAPAIGIAAVLGLTATSQRYLNLSSKLFIEQLKKDSEYLSSSRPTAVNLSWALKRCLNKVAESAKSKTDTLKLWEILKKEALEIKIEDVAMCKKIGEYGATLFSKTAMTTVLTHCNAGALATGGYGTALSPMYIAKENGLDVQVYSDETRPLLQGSRLTAWELSREGIPVTTICDSTAATLLRDGKIDIVITGADRIAANGDTANKIGTYSLAVNAKYHNIPFYIAAPYSTFDFSLKTGADIPIEERSANEVINFFGKKTGTDKASIYNPAFDVTPAGLIDGFITNKGIFKEASLIA